MELRCIGDARRSIRARGQRVGGISFVGLTGSGARLRRARTHVAYETRDSGGGAIGLRLTLGGSITIIEASVGGETDAICTFNGCGDAALHEPHPQSKPRVDEASLTVVAEELPPPSVADWLIVIAEPQIMSLELPTSESSSGSKPEQPRHQTVISPVKRRTSRLEAVGGRLISTP